MDKYKFGEFIYQKRKKLGMTQDELGRLLGVTNKAVSKWETGETTPEISMLDQLAKILKVSVDELLTQKDSIVEEKEKKTKNNLLITSVIVLAVLLVISIAILIYNKYKLIYIDFLQSNYYEIVDINKMERFDVNDNQEITITSSYELINAYEVLDDISFRVNVEVNFYYYKEDDSIGVMSFYNRSIDVLLDSNNKKEISITLSPKEPITSFKGIKRIDVSYTVSDCVGKVIVKDITNEK